ncbi:MAG: hypothetical protein ACTSXP_17080, partial [Promethearchaeota archaeon]
LYLRVEKLDNSPADGGVGAKHLVPDGNMRNNINVGESIDVDDGLFQINFRDYSFSIPHAKVSSETHGLSDNTMAVSSNFSNPVASSPDPLRIAVLIHGVKIPTPGIEINNSEIEFKLIGGPEDMEELMGELDRLETRDGEKYYDRLLNFGYDFYTTETLDIAEQLATFINRDTHEGDVIDIYGYSYGGIVARTFIKYFWNKRPNMTHNVNIEYVFTMGTPNRGIYVNIDSPEYLIDLPLVGDAFWAVIRPVEMTNPIPNTGYIEYSSFIRDVLGTYATHSHLIDWTAIRGDKYEGVKYIYGWSAMSLNGPLSDGVVPTDRCLLDGMAKNILLHVDHGGTRDINTIMNILDASLMPEEPEETPVFSGAGFLLAILSSLVTSMLFLMVSFIRNEPRAKHK